MSRVTHYFRSALFMSPSSIESTPWSELSKNSHLQVVRACIKFYGCAQSPRTLSRATLRSMLYAGMRVPNFEQYIKWYDKDDDGGGSGGGQRIFDTHSSTLKKRTNENSSHIPLWKRPTQMANRF